MKYKGYTGVVELEEGSEVLFGHVIGLRDVITFQGTSVAEVTQAFHDSVDDYLEFCAELGRSPEKTYSGQLVLRLAPEVHGELAELAERRSMSLNALIDAAVRKALWCDIQERLGLGDKTDSDFANFRIGTREERAASLRAAKKRLDAREAAQKLAHAKRTAQKLVDAKKRTVEKRAASETSLDKDERVMNKVRKLSASRSKKKST
jgi:predicted HicB family RNase H-like nuclease